MTAGNTVSSRSVSQACCNAACSRSVPSGVAAGGAWAVSGAVSARVSRTVIGRMRPPGGDVDGSSQAIKIPRWLLADHRLLESRTRSAKTTQAVVP
jgi:hypothetical protein